MKIHLESSARRDPTERYSMLEASKEVSSRYREYGVRCRLRRYLWAVRIQECETSPAAPEALLSYPHAISDLLSVS